MNCLSAEDRDSIERNLTSLIGKPLCEMHRYCGIQVFGFGSITPTRTGSGREIEQVEYSLAVGCFWKITGLGAFSLGSENFPEDGQRTDQHAEEFYGWIESEPLVVTFVSADSNGELQIQLTPDFQLRVSPPINCDWADEEWRINLPGSEPHSLTLGSKGLEW
jgi:hypothetical protein